MIRLAIYIPDGIPQTSVGAVDNIFCEVDTLVFAVHQDIASERVWKMLNVPVGLRTGKNVDKKKVLKFEAIRARDEPSIAANGHRRGFSRFINHRVTGFQVKWKHFNTKFNTIKPIGEIANYSKDLLFEYFSNKYDQDSGGSRISSKGMQMSTAIECYIQNKQFVEVPEADENVLNDGYGESEGESEGNGPWDLSGLSDEEDADDQWTDPSRGSIY